MNNSVKFQEPSKAAKWISSEAPNFKSFSPYSSNPDVKLFYYTAHFDPESRVYKNN